MSTSVISDPHAVHNAPDIINPNFYCISKPVELHLSLYTA